MIPVRRSLLKGGAALGALIAAPAIVRAQKKYDPGVSDKEIKLGTWLPLTVHNLMGEKAVFMLTRSPGR